MGKGIAGDSCEVVLVHEPVLVKVPSVLEKIGTFLDKTFDANKGLWADPGRASSRSSRP